MRVVIELKTTAQNADVVLNQLYSHTQLQQTFGIINLALVDNVPRVMTLKEMLEGFVDHRHEVVLRRSKFELDQAEERLHIVDGLRIAVDNIDEVVQLIRTSGDTDVARAGLMERFDLSERQAQAILDMRLARLTGLEREKLEEEYQELLKTIARLKELLGSKRLRMEAIKDELREIAHKYGDERRTEIQVGGADISMEDLIAEEDMVVTISHTGYIKRIAASTYRRQRRGGRGVTGMGTKDDDWIERLYVASTHDYLLVFTEQGKCHWLKVYDIPQGGRASRGRPIVNVLETSADDNIADVIPVREFDDRHYVITASQLGQVKKTVLSAYGNPRRGGIIGMKLDAGDRVISAQLTDGTNDIVLATRRGQAIRFAEDEVRDMGRDTMGVRGITLEGKNDGVLDMVVVKNESNALLSVTENGYGKRTLISDYRVTHRGGKGIKTLNPTAKTGPLVAVKEVVEQDELMIVTTGGIIIRLPIQGIRVMGRATQGVKLINLDAGHKVGDVARVVLEEEDEGASNAEVDSPAQADEQLELPSEEE
jgi:DNA gyrase subunit A